MHKGFNRVGFWGEPTGRIFLHGNDVPVAAEVAKAVAAVLRHRDGVFDLYVADLRVDEVCLDGEDHAGLQRPRIRGRDVRLLV